jgi:hypothetical protein
MIELPISSSVADVNRFGRRNIAHRATPEVEIWAILQRKWWRRPIAVARQLKPTNIRPDT